MRSESANPPEIVLKKSGRETDHYDRRSLGKYVEDCYYLSDCSAKQYRMEDKEEIISGQQKHAVQELCVGPLHAETFADVAAGRTPVGCLGPAVLRWSQ